MQVEWRAPQFRASELEALLASIPKNSIGHRLKLDSASKPGVVLAIKLSKPEFLETPNTSINGLAKLSTLELIQRTPNHELLILDDPTLADAFIDEALTVPIDDPSFGETAAKLKACLGSRDRKDFFKRELELNESFSSKIDVVEKLKALELLCTCQSTKSPGAALAELYYMNKSEDDEKLNPRILKTIPLLSNTEQEAFVRQLFLQEADEYTSNKRLSNFENAIEYLITSDVEVYNYVPWLYANKFTRATQKYLGVLLLEDEANGIKELERAKEVFIMGNSSFVNLVEGLWYIDQCREAPAEECLSFLENIKSDTKRLREELELLIDRPELTRALISRGLVGQLLPVMKEIESPAMRLFCSSREVAASTCESLLSIIGIKARSGEDFTYERRVILEVWKHAEWDSRSSEGLKMALNDLLESRSNEAVADFINKDISELLFRSCINSLSGISFGQANIQGLIGESPEETFRHRPFLISTMNSASRVSPSEPVSYFQIIYRSLTYRCLEDPIEFNPEKLLNIVRKMDDYSTHSLLAIGHICVSYLSAGLRRNPEQDSRCLNGVLTLIETLNYDEASLIFRFNNLLDLLESSLTIAQLEGASELIDPITNRLSRIVSLYQRNENERFLIEDDGA